LLITAAVSGLTTIVGWQVWDILTRDVPADASAGRGPLFALGLIGLAEFIPTAVLSPFTGTLADRFERRRVVFLGLVLEASAAAMLLAYAATDPTEVWPIYVMVMWFGATQAVVNPALRSLPVDMSPPHQLQRVVALNSAPWRKHRWPCAGRVRLRAGHAPSICGGVRVIGIGCIERNAFSTHDG
jgi:MFS family permease